MTYTPNDVMPHSHIQVHTHTSTHSESGALGSNVSGYFLKVLQVLVLYLDLPLTLSMKVSATALLWQPSVITLFYLMYLLTFENS